MEKYWKLIKVEKKFQDHILNIDHKYYEFLKNGETHPFCAINTKNWVVIIPVTDNGRFVLVRQFRFAVEDTTLEFPGGAIDLGEPHSLAAVRELEEETGYKSDDIRYLGFVHPNPAILSNKCHIYVAYNCKNVGKTNFDKFEDIEIVLMDETEFKKYLIDNKITHSIVVAAYTKYLLSKDQ
ncbi:NUDIX hydrolase [Deferribacter autotrophicus]|uniref:GDP-mannose pyrophosphatase n=1 Tax=Deferribacter autotrophicus TaxID=500465 RepID=A0A5A8F6U4_9BACT|nr:NUDIX hydrolase [Deferribacter autotrophicus]KAA0258989.1 NUDIX hydrolase [Deferribacter autotrophicus]